MSMTIVNVEMAKAWDEEAVEWTREADRYDASGARHWQRFLDAGLISSTDRVLDIGCGTGQSSRDAARLAAEGSVLGVDLSTQMLDDARRRAEAEGLTNVTFERADAQVHPFDEGAYDVAISRFGAMFFADAGAAFANVGRALKPGGRLAIQGWQGLANNEWLLAFRSALAAGRDLPAPPNGVPGPFALADPDGVRSLLRGAGFDDAEFTSVEEPMYMGTDLDDAWVFVSGQGIFRGLTDGLDDATKAEAIAKLKQVLVDNATDDGVLLGAASWIITARRV
jgi:SAM-dependent methyltransferase